MYFFHVNLIVGNKNKILMLANFCEIVFIYNLAELGTKTEETLISIIVFLLSNIMIIIKSCRVIYVEHPLDWSH